MYTPRIYTGLRDLFPMMMNKQKMKNGNLVSIFLLFFALTDAKGMSYGSRWWHWKELREFGTTNLNKTHFYRFFTRVSSFPLPSSHLGTIQMEKMLYFSHDDTELLKHFVSRTVSSVPAHLSHFGIVVCRRRRLHLL